MVLWSTKVGPRSCSSDCDFVQRLCFDVLPNAWKARKNVLQTFLSIFRHVDKSLIA